MPKHSLFRRWRHGRQQRQLVDFALDGETLLDRVEAGDPGTPARVIAPDVAGRAALALRLGERLVAEGVLTNGEYERTATRLRALRARAERSGG